MALEIEHIANDPNKVRVEIMNHTAGGQHHANKPGTQLTFYKEKVGPNHYRVFVCHPDFSRDDLDQAFNPCRPTDCKCGGFLTTDSYILEINQEQDEKAEALLNYQPQQQKDEECC